MAKQITVTVPDELRERLVKLGKRFNVSATCTEAIEREVEIGELLTQKKGNTMKATLDRLHMQKAKLDEQYLQAGKAAGIRDAKNLNYADLVSVARGMKELEDVTIPASDEGYWGIVKGIEMDSNLQDDIKDLEHDDPGFNAARWCRGWCEGVAAFWAEVAPQL